MTIKEILEKAILELINGKIVNPHLDAEILLSHILNKKREYLIAHNDKEVNKNIFLKYSRLIKKRIKNIPIAYLIEYKYFCGYKFFVNKNALIPRPETELIVSEVIKLITTSKKNSKNTFIDIGTGTGCIAISVLKELVKIKNQKKINKFYAIDISKSALKIARKNSKTHKVSKKIKFINGSLLKPIFNIRTILNNSSNLIISANLPYLTPKQIKTSESIQAEPNLALEAGCDGLKYYKILFNQIVELKKIFKPNIYLFIEIDPKQANKLKKIVNKKFKKSFIIIKKDLAGLNRMIKISV